MWQNSRVTKYVYQQTFSKFLHKSATPRKKWVSINPTKVDTNYNAEVNCKTTALSNKEFQKKLEDCLTELKEAVPKIPGLVTQDLSTDKNLQNHPLVKAMSERNSVPWPKEFLDEKSSTVLSSDQLKREFLKQTAMCHEFTHKFNVPACGFESFSMKEVDDCLLTKQSMVFILRKAAMKSRDEIKKQNRRLLKEETPRSDMPTRSDPIPTYNLRKRLHNMAEYRIERNRHDDYPLIIDMSFDSFMHDKAQKSMHKQLDSIMKYNISHTTPFSIMYCNFRKSSSLYNSMMKTQSFGFPNGLASVTYKSLVEIDDLDIEDLVYLCPDAAISMEEFDMNKSYVIGGLVDVGNYGSLKATYNAARRLGIKKVKFPLQKYLLWGNKTGRDELTLDVAFQVLHTFRDTGSWIKAFVHVPKRFHRGLTEFGLSQLKDSEEDLLDWYNTAYDRRLPSVTPDFRKDSTSCLGWS